jgi:peptidoglycan hydrolase-like protein with peptidoglycan-binding domain
MALLASASLAGCGGLAGTPPVTTHASGSSTTAVSGSSSTTTSTMTVLPTTTTTTTTTTTPVPSTLVLGDSGPRVLALQRRLSSLDYWLGEANGQFGDSTQQAVYALQKGAGIARDGIVGSATQAALARGVVPTPRSTIGYVVEVDLSDDLIMIVDNGKVSAILNTSTGGGYTYVDDGVTAVANTPVGVFHVYRQVDGLVTDSLGQLWRPKYFSGGFAIHGDSYVPPYPVSHGCVRVSNEAIDWIWAENLLPIGTEVWVY